MTETVPDTRSAVEKMQARAEAFAQGDGQALADRDKKTQTGSELFQSDLDDTLQWPLLADMPSEARVDKPLRPVEGLQGEQFSQHLRQEAREIMDSDSTVANLIHVNALRYLKSSSGFRDQNIPVEANMLAALAYKSHAFRHDTPRDTQEAIKAAAVAVLPALLENGYSYDSYPYSARLDTYRNRTMDAAKTALRQLDAQSYGRNDFRGQDFLDGCVLSSLACGDVTLAFDFIEHADEYTGQSNSTEAAINRLATMFYEAYNEYPASKKREFDALMSQKADLFPHWKNSDPAFNDTEAHQRSLPQEAHQRLKASTERDRDWTYASGKYTEVADVKAREASLSQEGLATLVDEAAERGQSRTDLETTLATQVDRVIEGKVGNALEAELRRRLHPDMNVATLMQNAQNEAVGKAPPRPDMGSSSRSLKQLFVEKQAVAGGELTVAERQQVIHDLYIGDGTVRECVIQPEKLEEKELFYFLKQPQTFCIMAEDAISNFVRDRERSQDMSEERKRLRLGIARKLAPAVMFLRAAVEGAPTEPREIPGEDGRMEPNPAYVPGETTSSLFRKTLANEFGLTQEVAPEKLDESIATLERFLSGNITYNTAVREKIRGDEGVEIIEGEELGKRMFAEVLPSDDQYASDLEQNEAIEEAMNRERAALLEEKEKELDGVIDTRDAALGDEIAHGQQVVTTAETTLSQMQAHKGRLEQEREQQRAALQAAEDKPLKKAAFGGLFGGAYTQDEKDADVARARAALADTESKIRTLSEQMESTRPTVNITSLEEKRRKLQSLKRAA